jgi:hypothetical protein
MPELTFSFDAPLEANHVSSEDTQAQLDEFRQMPWIKPDYKAATLDALRKVERSGVGTVPLLRAFSQGCVQAKYLLLTEAGTAHTSTPTIRPLSSARNPPCT